MAIDPSAPRSRRSILLGALGGAGAALVASLARAAPAAAADGDPLLAGETKTATTATGVDSTGDGLSGISATGIGVYGQSTGPGTGDVDPTSHSTGVIGVAGDGTGIFDVTDGTGVYGFSDDPNLATGVWGDTPQGVGTVGTGDWGVYGSGSIGVVGDVAADSNGVYGFSGDEGIIAPLGGAGVLGTGGAGGGVGVRGHASAGGSYGIIATTTDDTQYALYVAGKLRLKRAGRTTIASTATSKKISMAGVTTGSFVIATLQTSVSGCYVRNVVCGTGYFYIYLSKAPGKTVYVGYMVVN